MKILPKRRPFGFGPTNLRRPVPPPQPPIQHEELLNHRACSKYLKTFLSSIILVLNLSGFFVQAATLKIAEISALDLNCLFGADCAPIVNETTTTLTLVYSGGLDGTFITRLKLPKNAAGKPTEGLYGYEYQINMSALEDVCITAFSLPFSNVTPVDYNGDGVKEDAYVITQGGTGSIKPAKVEQTGETILFDFSASPNMVCTNQGSLAFGLVSSSSPAASTVAIDQLFVTPDVTYRPSFAVISGKGSQAALTVTKVGEGTVTGLGIDCGSDCDDLYSLNTLVTLTATPAAGYSFVEWQDGCAGSSSTTTVTMSAVKHCKAVFSNGALLKLNISKVGEGSVTSSDSKINCGADCEESYSPATSVTLTATPAAGYQFANWTVDCSGTSSTVTVIMNAAKNCVATFTAAPPSPEIDIQGNGLSIASGDATPSSADATDFGSVNIGDSRMNTFTLLNTGGAMLTITNVSLLGLGCDPFWITPPTSSTLAPNQPATFQVTFTPIDKGAFTCTVSIDNDDSDENPYIFSVQGTGQEVILPEAEIDVLGKGRPIPNGDTTPSPDKNTYFGPIKVTEKLVNVFTIRNIGSKELTVTKVALLKEEEKGKCGPFSLNPAVPSMTIGPKDSKEVSITFFPRKEGEFSCTVNIANNDSDENPYTFKVTGAGYTPSTGGGGGNPPLPPTSTLRVSIAGAGAGTVTSNPGNINCTKDQRQCEATYKTGTPVTLTPTPAPGSYFANWGGHEDCIDNKVEMFGSRLCVAFFNKLPELTVRKTGAGAGTVTAPGIDCGTDCTESYPPNTQVTLTPQAVAGAYFSHWGGHQDCLDGQVQMSENRSCLAVFKTLLELTVKVVGNGNVKGEGIDCGKDCVESYPLNKQVTLTAVPASGYLFQSWSGSCTGTAATITVTMDKAKTCVANFTVPQWTFMVYLNADNNLEPFGIDDFLEMAKVGSSTDVNIVVQFDRVNGYSSDNGDWTSCKRFLVKKDMQPTTENQISDIGECNMGAPETLTDFINWSTSTYPANRYALVIWNHGGGWRDLLRQDVYKEIAWDDTNGDVLFMKEVKQALNQATTDVHLIGFDACLMAMVEVGYELKDTRASVVVGSEQVEPFDGWPYHVLLADLVAHSNWNPSELGTAIVNHYYESYGNDWTQSAVLLNRMNNLANVTSTLANTIRTQWDNNPDEVKSAAQAVIDEIKLSVIHERHGTGWPGSHGLAIYFPLNQSQFDESYNGNQIDFPARTRWDEFLKDFYLKMNPASWIRTARILSQSYLPEHIDLYDFAEKLILQEVKPVACISPTIQSVNNGDWDDKTTWGVWDGTAWQAGIRKPNINDRVRVQNGHTVRISSRNKKINSLCNEGSILGQDGTSSSKNGTAGGNVRLTVENSFINKGKILAGRGGDGMFSGYYTHTTTRGGAGGNVFVWAQDFKNEGTIGPDAMQLSTYLSSYCLNGYPIHYWSPTGSMGGDGGTGHHWNETDSKPSGGNGGSTIIIGTNIDNQGRIAAGYGGNAQEHDDCVGIRQLQAMPRTTPAEKEAFEARLAELTAIKGGKGGNAVIIPLPGGSVTGMKEIDGGNGSIWIEPTILVGGQEVHIYNSKHLTIFGGDGATLSLNDLRDGAIEATETITLAVGENGIVDLRGNQSKVLKAGTSVKIFADTVLLDEGVTLQDLIDAPNIETYPNKILYHATLLAPGQLNGTVGETLPVDIIISNAGPAVDTYTLTVTDTAGWALSSLPNTLTVEGLQTTELPLSVTLPTASDTLDVITVTLTSQTDPTVVATTVIHVSAKAVGAIDSVVAGQLLDAQGNPIAELVVQIGDQVAMTDETGHWEISGLPTGNYTATLSTQEGVLLASQNNVVVSNEQPEVTVLFPAEGATPKPEPETPTFMLSPLTTCPPTGTIDFQCDNHGQVLTDAILGTHAIVSGGELAGTIISQGFVSQVLVQPDAVLTGGTLSGYVLNQGTIADVTFVGVTLQGGTLAGTIRNKSQVGGTLIDVTLAPNAHVVGGRMQGNIQGDPAAPAWLEEVRVLKESQLLGVKLGKGVVLEEEVEK